MIGVQHASDMYTFDWLHRGAHVLCSSIQALFSGDAEVLALHTLLLSLPVARKEPHPVDEEDQNLARGQRWIWPGRACPIVRSCFINFLVSCQSTNPIRIMSPNG